MLELWGESKKVEGVGIMRLPSVVDLCESISFQGIENHHTVPGYHRSTAVRESSDNASPWRSGERKVCQRCLSDTPSILLAFQVRRDSRYILIHKKNTDIDNWSAL